MRTIDDASKSGDLNCEREESKIWGRHIYFNEAVNVLILLNFKFLVAMSKIMSDREKNRTLHS